VFLPGLFETPHVWRDIIDRLGLEDPLCLDLPGHVPRQSSKQVRTDLRTGAWLDDIARRIGRRHRHRPVVLVGHSTGGLLALQLAERHPSLVSGLFLVGALTSGDRGRWFDPVAHAMTVAAIGRPLSRAIWSVWLGSPRRFRRWIDMAAGAHVDLQGAEAMRRTLRACDPDAISACAEWVIQADIRDILGRINAPILSLIGARDRVVAPHHQLDLIRRAPNAQAMLMNGGHLLFAERPEDAVTALCGWLLHCGRTGRRAHG
jgi:pimeloyl-ACP methyl ester carboxylesterase